MKCPKCEAELQENARFCAYCMTSFDHKIPAGVPVKRRVPAAAIAAAGGCAALAVVLLFLFAILPRFSGGRPSGTAPLLTAAETEPGSAQTTDDADDSVQTKETAPVSTEQKTAPGGETGPVQTLEAPHTHTPVTDPAVAPTCTEEGLTEGSHCSVCHAVITAQKTLPAKGHTVVNDAAAAPTCTEEGLTEGSHCSVCHAVITAQKTVPAKGHKAVTDPAVAPTCMHTGLTEGSHCSVCGEVFTEQTAVAKVSHQYKDATYTEPATCIWCGATKGTKLPAPSIMIEINTGSGFPRKSSYNGNLRINAKPTVETVYNGDGTYTVKVRVSVTNLASYSIVGAIPAKIGYYTSREADDGWGGELLPGETGEKGAIFYNVEGGIYYVTV